MTVRRPAVRQTPVAWPARLGAALMGMALLVSAAPACRSSSTAQPVTQAQPGDAGPAAAMVGSQPSAQLPAAPGRWAPAHTEREPAGAGADEAHPVSGAHLADVDDCADCHLDIAAQWQASAHAFASFSNPIYRVSIEGFRAANGARASRFCGGCHDPALLIDGVLDAHAAEDTPAGAVGHAERAGGASEISVEIPVEIPAEIPADDARAHAGVSCRVCHGISEVRPDGNGSYTLAAEPIPLPRDGDADSLARHREVASRTRLGSDLCMPCHRSHLGPGSGHPDHLVGMDDVSDWQTSAFAHAGIGRVDEAIAKQTCIDCHMARVPAPRGDPAAKDGTVASHLFPGGHTWLAAMRADQGALAATQALLETAVSLDLTVSAMSPGGGYGGALRVGDTPAVASAADVDAVGLDMAVGLNIDVAIRNLGVGHRFPGGVRDAQDVWVEVEVREPSGRLLASSGLAHERDPDDREAHVLTAWVADGDGALLREREVHAFRAPVADHTVPARDVALVRYQLPLAPSPALEVYARLRHRTRSLAMQRAACQATRSERGRGFTRATERYRGVTLDPCEPQPITTLAEQRVWIDADGARRGRDDVDTRADGADARAAELTSSARPSWRRLYEHGLGWLRAPQEHIAVAGPSLRAALDQLPATATTERAMVSAALGRLAGRQGRTGESLEWYARADALTPGHPALAAGRAAALAQVWRWGEAATWWRRAAGRVPQNPRVQAALAQALGSLGHDAPALVAAQRGLAVIPRDAALLRSQALALAALGGDDAAAAMTAYDRHRSPDLATAVRFACAARDAACAREQPQVHIHPLVPARAPGRQK